MSSSPGIPQEYPELLDRGYMTSILKGLKEAKAGGIETIVDATTLDLGRDVNVLAEAARSSGVNIIACTGWWMEKLRFLVGLSPDRLAAVFVRDIEKGIAGTNIKAGVLKGASDMAGVTPEEETVLRAIARAHLQTGVPIMLHSYSPGQVGRRQIAILSDEKVDLTRVKLDHSNDTTDLEYLEWILDQGCYLGLDMYPGQNVSSLARTRTLKALIEAGHQDHLCLSHDWSLARVNEAKTIIGTPEKRKIINPEGFLYINRVVFPQLRELGVSEKVISRLLVEGPRNFFEGRQGG
jgi:phosphotriesterase-related protein